MSDDKSLDQYAISPEFLPPGWAKAVVEDVCRGVQSGFASGEHNKAGQGVPHLRPMNIDRLGRLNLSEVKFVSANADERRVIRGDVLFNNTNSPVLIGKTCAISSNADLAFSNHMTRLRVGPGMDPRFLAAQLHYLWMSGYFLHRCVKHVNQASISSEVLARTVPIAVAPSKEQTRIADVLDTYFTELEATATALERVQANLKRYRAAVLQAAVSGRLVPTEAELARREGRDYEPASFLLKRILEEKDRSRTVIEPARMRTGERNIRQRGPSDGSGPWVLPDGWSWARLGDIFDVIVGATPSRGVPKYWNGNIPWVSSGEVAFCRISKTRECISETGLAESSTKLSPPGTVLIGMIGEGRTRGQVAILDVAACNNQNAAAIRVSEAGLSPDYVFYYLMSQYEQNRKLGSGNNQPALNKARVQAIMLALPPHAEQFRIAKEVERRLSIVVHAEHDVEIIAGRVLRLRAAVLKWAFEGQLVEQDPADEDATVLLDRIRAERETTRTRATSPVGRSRRRTA